MATACKKWASVFGTLQPVIIGMIHVQALPGTPHNCLPMMEIVRRAVEEARIYRDTGLDALLVENMHDTPYLRGVGSEVTAAMTRVACEVRAAVPQLPLGVQILAGCNKEALSVALASGGSFIRAECFVYSHVADEGWMDACAGELLRYRRTIGAEEIMVLADIKKKHCSHSVTGDLSIGETAQAARFFAADGVIVTGASTAQPANTCELDTVRTALGSEVNGGLPILVGSGVTVENLDKYMCRVNGLIVGSEFKEGGLWSNAIDVERVRKFLRRKHELLP